MVPVKDQNNDQNSAPVGAVPVTVKEFKGLDPGEFDWVKAPGVFRVMLATEDGVGLDISLDFYDYDEFIGLEGTELFKNPEYKKAVAFSQDVARILQNNWGITLDQFNNFSQSLTAAERYSPKAVAEKTNEFVSQIGAEPQPAWTITHFTNRGKVMPYQWYSEEFRQRKADHARLDDEGNVLELFSVVRKGDRTFLNRAFPIGEVEIVAKEGEPVSDKYKTVVPIEPVDAMVAVFRHKDFNPLFFQEPNFEVVESIRYDNEVSTEGSVTLEDEKGPLMYRLFTYNANGPDTDQ